ncbi:3-dehydroquinate synthase [Colwellia sp. E2M01]|uniref:3-dehydroquinate synthase n=1 Tax=Colwellia sp. E2M01 TaxID=2841561 RepID=UPI001C090B0D|nr:3-dehydroquinate synthase [Colwellia sp. E2M01]MBU2869437.1 3-dehydroquinate synthase [Colwellia sp. E2M01]
MSDVNTLEQYTIKQKFTLHYEYPVLFTREVFDQNNNILIDLIDNRNESPKVMAVIDQGLCDSNPLLPQQIADYLELHEINVLPEIIVPGGEACKNDEQLIDSIYQAVETHAIDRHSYILVLGGGAVVDAIGFAAATAHRGIRLIRIPTTVLGQNDAGVGVKNAVNYHHRKNYIGTFAPPFAVINDFDLLTTLSDRDKRSGISEAIKVALIKDNVFFTELYQSRHELAKFEDAPMQNMIIKGAKWHLNHIATSGDPFELGSARPLDFGHWSAHKLEELSNNELRHGEAVAIGIAIDSIYSMLAGHLSTDELQNILALLKDVGFELNHSILSKLDISKALAEFKEHLGGDLCITLLSNIGTGFEVNVIDEVLMVQAIEQLKSL